MATTTTGAFGLATGSASSAAGSHSLPCQATPYVGGDGEWVQLLGFDAFPGEDAGSPLSVKGMNFEPPRLHCRQHGYGGFVAWQGQAFFRKRPARELVANASSSPQSMLWVPARELATSWSSSSLPFTLPSSLPEVEVPGARQVEKLAGLSEAAMTRRFQQSQPVVLTDAQQGWPARTKWTFQWLSENYGREEIPCSDLAPFFTSDRGRIQTVHVSMAEYIRYIVGETNGLRALHKTDERVFYGNGWCPFMKDDSLLADVSDRLYCVRDSIPRGDGPTKHFNTSLTKVFLGPAGTVSRLHHDTYATHVWLSQIKGRKQFICFPPSDHDKLYGTEDTAAGRTSEFDPAAPDYKTFPEARKASAYSVVVEEGETVVLPAQWWHWAKSLTPSVTLMRNFVNETNMQDYLAIRERVDRERQERTRA